MFPELNKTLFPKWWPRDYDYVRNTGSKPGLPRDKRNLNWSYLPSSQDRVITIPRVLKTPVRITSDLGPCESIQHFYSGEGALETHYIKLVSKFLYLEGNDLTVIPRVCCDECCIDNVSWRVFRTRLRSHLAEGHKNGRVVIDHWGNEAQRNIHVIWRKRSRWWLSRWTRSQVVKIRSREVDVGIRLPLPIQRTSPFIALDSVLFRGSAVMGIRVRGSSKHDLWWTCCYRLVGGCRCYSISPSSSRHCRGFTWADYNDELASAETLYVDNIRGPSIWSIH